jgi:hypothetical protein
MNVKVLGISVFIMAIALLVSPVLAIGPTKPLKVGNNPKFQGNIATGLVEIDAAENSLLWINAVGMFMHDAKATTGMGRMNNAIIADISILMAMGADFEAYSKMWIFLSGDNSGNSWNNPFDNPDAGTHGMLYWFGEAVFGPGYGADLVAEHPDGVFITWNLVGK